MSNEVKPGQFDSAQNAKALATLAFPNLFEARAFQRNGKAVGKERFDAALELDADNPDIPALKAKALAVAKAKFPNLNVAEEYKAGRFKMPWSTGDKLAEKAIEKGKKREWSRGRIVLTARSEYPPALSVIENGNKVDYFGQDRDRAKDAFYFGVKVFYGVTFTAYDVDDKKGVNAYLDWLISSKTGLRLAGGSRSADEVYSGYAGVLSSEDPTVGTVADTADDL